MGLARILCFRGNVSSWLLVVGIAAMPPLSYLFVAGRMEDSFALLPCAIFGLAHVGTTWANSMR